MAIIEKTKIGNRAIFAILIVSLILLFLTEYQTVEIVYFTNPRCALTDRTDDILEEIKEDFKDRIEVREIKVNMYPEDPPDTQEIKKLREKYRVHGVPDIIINGKEFTEKFTKDNLREEVCKNFIIRPGACR